MLWPFPRTRRVSGHALLTELKRGCAYVNEFLVLAKESWRGHTEDFWRKICPSGRPEGGGVEGRILSVGCPCGV